MHETSPFRFSMIYNFLVCDTWKETCKNPVCTEVWSLNTFVCLKMPQNSLSVSVNVQLHLTADAGDHLTRKIMNLLLGRIKIGAFFTSHETSSIKYDQVSSLNLTDQSVWWVSWYHLVAIRRWESHGNTENKEWQRTNGNFFFKSRWGLT